MRERERNDLKSIKIILWPHLSISDSVPNHTPHTESPLQYFMLATELYLSLIEMDAVRLFTFSTLVLDIDTSQKEKKKEKVSHMSHYGNAWRLKAGPWADPSEIEFYLNIIHKIAVCTGIMNSSPLYSYRYMCLTHSSDTYRYMCVCSTEV